MTQQQQQQRSDAATPQETSTPFDAFVFDVREEHLVAADATGVVGVSGDVKEAPGDTDVLYVSRDFRLLRCPQPAADADAIRVFGGEPQAVYFRPLPCRVRWLWDRFEGMRRPLDDFAAMDEAERDASGLGDRMAALADRAEQARRTLRRLRAGLNRDHPGIDLRAVRPDEPVEPPTASDCWPAAPTAAPTASSTSPAVRAAYAGLLARVENLVGVAAAEDFAASVGRHEGVEDAGRLLASLTAACRRAAAGARTPASVGRRMQAFLDARGV